MVQTRQPNNPPDVAEIIAQQLQNIILNIVTQVTKNLNNGNGNGNGGGNNGCTYKGFVACGPRDFDRTGGAVALTRWIEKMESVIDNSGCLANQRVKYAASSFIGKALTWWNTQVQARGRDAANAMAWDDFKALLTTEFSAILTAGILINEAVHSGTLAKAGEKRKERDEAISNVHNYGAITMSLFLEYCWGYHMDYQCTQPSEEINKIIQRTQERGIEICRQNEELNRVHEEAMRILRELIKVQDEKRIAKEKEARGLEAKRKSQSAKISKKDLFLKLYSFKEITNDSDFK
ncbi:hypothetical protein Tco_1485496 [Tanacetum coccineum]